MTDFFINTISEEKIARVEIESDSPGPLWNYGSTTIARYGDKVYASIPELKHNHNSLCNMRWILLERSLPGYWRAVSSGSLYNEREPFPLGIRPAGKLILSVNPCKDIRNYLPNNKTAHNSTPMLIEFDLCNFKRKKLYPKWNKSNPKFTEHSYRGMSIDFLNNDLLLLNISGYDGYAWSYANSDGLWVKNGFIRYPIRSAYPQVALRNKTAAIVTVSDVIEPNSAWRNLKKMILNQDWDYDFRQLFFSYTPDITAVDFSPPLTIASMDETAGHIRNMDLWIDSQGRCHILYTQRNIWRNCIRDHFFPNIPIQVSLKYCIISEGYVTYRSTLLECTENLNDNLQTSWTGNLANYACFHIGQNEEIYVIVHLASSNFTSGNYIFQVDQFSPNKLKKIKLISPQEAFFCASPRLGSQPSNTVDLYSTEVGWSYEDFYPLRKNNGYVDINYVQLNITNQNSIEKKG